MANFNLFKSKAIWMKLCQLILVVIVIFFGNFPSAIAYGSALHAIAQSYSSPTPTKQAIAPEDLVEVKLTVLGVDPVKGEVEARLQFLLKGIYKLTPTYPAQDLLLTVNAADPQVSQTTFLQGKPMEIGNLNFNIVRGKINSYPFDNHIARIAISLDPLPSISNQFAPFELKPVPLAFKFEADVPGFDVTYKPLKQNSSIFVYIDISIDRSIPVKFFAIVIILIMWVLSTLALLLALKVMESGNLPEIGMLSWMGVMLFAFPAIRNTQPAVPPVGTLSDFLSLFWTETIVVIAISILGTCWLQRYNAGD